MYNTLSVFLESSLTVRGRTVIFHLDAQQPYKSYRLSGVNGCILKLSAVEHDLIDSAASQIHTGQRSPCNIHLRHVTHNKLGILHAGIINRRVGQIAADKFCHVDFCLRKIHQTAVGSSDHLFQEHSRPIL